MTVPVDLPLGRRIEIARTGLGLSRQMLGDLIGRSGEWVRQAERGDRAVDRLSTLLRLATVLKVADLPAFLGCAAPRAPTAGPAVTAVQTVSDALYRLPSDRLPGDEPTAALDDGTVEVAWAAWQDSASPYATTLARLPALVRACADAPATPAAAYAYRLACAVLRHLGDLPAALLAAHRAVAVSRLSGCAMTEASCLGTYADTLVRLGSAGEATTVCRQAIALLVERSRSAGPAQAISGRLHLVAARSAAAQHAPRSAERWLVRAADTAREGASVDPRHPFDLADVRVHAVRIALRLGQLRHAVTLAQTVDVAAVPARVRRCRGYITVASAHARAQNPSAVIYALSKAEQSCGEELRYNGDARAIIGDLLAHENALIRTDLLGLAARAGVA